jgi:PAS domain S-box-containing protein
MVSFAADRLHLLKTKTMGIIMKQPEKSRRWWAVYKNYVQKVLLNDADPNLNTVSYWRDSVFCYILTYLTPLSLIALIPCVFMSFRDGLPEVGCADLLTFCLIAFITLFQGIKIAVRKFIFTSVIYCLAIILLYYLSMPGPGMLFLLAATLFTSLIYSSSAAYYSAIVNTAICLFFAVLFYLNIEIPYYASLSLGAWIAISSNLVFLSFACAKCLDFLLLGLTNAINNNKIAESKLEKANRLYKFSSHINQSIVHAKDEETLYKKTCEIALTIGKFKMAWIQKFTSDNKVVTLIYNEGMNETTVDALKSCDTDELQDHILRSGTPYVCNNIESDPKLEKWKRLAEINSIHSCIILPIKREGKVFGTLNIGAGETDYFDEEEIASLVEASGEISFALEVFEKVSRSKEAEDQIIRNEMLFKALTENGADMKTLTGTDGIPFYASPSITKILGYTTEEALQIPPSEIMHPDDLPVFIESIQYILQTASSSIYNEHRLRHKNGNYVWCEGSITNMLHEPHVNAIVSNFREITKRKKAEEKLIKANRLYAFISAINQSIVHIQDEHELLQKACDIAIEIGKFKSAWIGMLNEEGKLELVCFRGDQALSETIEKLLIDEVQKHVFGSSSISKALREGTPAISNNVLNDPSMDFLREVLVSSGVSSNLVCPIKKTGKVVGIFSFDSDIMNFFDETEIGLLQEATRDVSFALDVFEKEKRHKQAEEIILKNENRFRSLIEHSKDLKTLTSKEGVLIYGSPSVTHLLGYSTEEYINKSAFSFFHPDDLPDLIKNRNLILDIPGKSFEFQYRILHKNGNWIWCQGTLTNMLHEPGIQAFVSNFQDISKNRELNKRLRLATTSAGIGIWDWDIVNNNFHWDERMYKLYQIDEKQFGLVFEGWIARIHEEDRAQAISHIQNAILRVQEYNTEFRIVWNDLSVHYVQASGIVERDSKGNAIRMIGANWDITEIRRKEQEKEKITADLIQRNKNLEQFSYMVSHNLRAPVANILGFAELMSYKNINPDVILESVKGMSNAAQKLDTVIKDINQILQAKTIVSASREDVDFQHLIDDISLSIDNILKNKNVTIRTDFNNIGKMVSVKAYLHSILYNMIINSVKFHKPDVPPDIEIKSFRTTNGVQLTFKDNGIGIDLEKHQGNLFGLYKRFHPHIEGKGMGLFMIKTQVETLGGKISINSEVNKGVEFTLDFDNNNYDKA